MRGLLVALNVLLGPTVLASYVWAARTFPDQTTALWGEVPEAVRPAYTANMFLAAAGYLVFTWLLVLRADPANARFFGGRVGSGVVGVAYAMILLGSIVWMPLTSYALEAGRPELVPWIVVDLGVVALGTPLLIGCLLSIAPRPRGRVVALVGAAFFALQTVVLDAVVWPLYFTIPA